MIDMHPVAGQIAQIAAETEGFGGTIGIASRHLHTGEEILLNEDAIFPTASTFKTILLYELYRQQDAGAVDVTERVTIEDRLRVPGSGVIQHIEAGATMTLKDLAMLMIILSDNTATDMIFHLLGKDAVAKAVRDLGLANTSLPLPTWEILAGMFDRAGDPDLSYDDLRQLLKSVDPAWDCDALKETRDNDVITPRDYRDLYVAIHAGTGLSDSAQSAVMDILTRQTVGDRLPARLPLGVTAAHKTGSIKGVRNDGGLVYGHDGVEYAVAIMTKGARDGVIATRLVADVSKTIYDHYAA